MIPRILKISGFLSYQDEVEIDFTTIHVACISGQNGAGKSALLDAITWSLFGEARKNDESVINDTVKNRRAEVTFEFEYEKNIYKIIRIREQGKSSAVEFQVWDDSADRWRVLTESTVTQTNKRICHTLHLDYKTFINVSFFLQGKADQFTKQNASERKDVLSSILDLDRWEFYQIKATDARKERANRLAVVEGRLDEIDKELAEESQRQIVLHQLTEELSQAEMLRKARQDSWQNAQKTEILYSAQKKNVDDLHKRNNQLRQQTDADHKKLSARMNESASYKENLKNEELIGQSIQHLKQIQTELTLWNDKAADFFILERQRDGFISRIETERIRLAQTQKSLRQEFDRIVLIRENLPVNQQKEITLRQEINGLMHETETQKQIIELLHDLTEKESEKKAELFRMKNRMTEIKHWMDNLTDAIGTPCPFCGRNLDDEHCERYLEQLKEEGSVLGDQYRSEMTELSKLTTQKSEYNENLNRISQLTQKIIYLEKNIAPLSAQIASDKETLDRWHQTGEKALEEVEKKLSTESFCLDIRDAIKVLSGKIDNIGYDAAAHEICKKTEEELRPVEKQWQGVQRAKAALEPLEREISELTAHISNQEDELLALCELLKEQEKTLEELSGMLPDVTEARELFEAAQTDENRLRAKKGAAEQLVAVLEERKTSKKGFLAEKKELHQSISRLKVLEKAFSKNGIPALLIDQALPEIEDNANEILEKLTDDKMSLQLSTLRDYRDKTRDSKKETLDIIISDGFGTRDYEMFSGGEAFRINFAIRLALSKVLAKRAGARLQILVIDEGFGSQDSEGREKLIEAITAIQNDFEKILVITHLDELKDSFPSRIEVEKTAGGSQVKVFS
ncbi:MAG: AAA family ATPase [Flexilinea sp.]